HWGRPLSPLQFRAISRNGSARDSIKPASAPLSKVTGCCVRACTMIAANARKSADVSPAETVSVEIFSVSFTAKTLDGFRLPSANPRSCKNASASAAGRSISRVSLGRERALRENAREVLFGILGHDVDERISGFGPRPDLQDPD